METKVKKAVKILTNALKADEDFYYSYQANIAMAFKDEYIRNKKKDIHKIANQAAKNFLNLWIN